MARYNVYLPYLSPDHEKLNGIDARTLQDCHDLLHFVVIKNECISQQSGISKPCMCDYSLHGLTMKL